MFPWINIESWTTYWDLWSKWYILNVIQVLLTIAHDSSVLKHEKLLHMILIQYITVWNIIVIYKYTCTLIHNYAFTQHTHIIFSEKFNITIAVCVVQIKTSVTLNNMQYHTCNFSNRHIVYMNVMLPVISHSHQFHHNYTNFPKIISL